MTALTIDLPAAAADTRTTRRLLLTGAVAAPVFAVLALAQVVSRPGFDFMSHPVSMLSNGPGGWVQVANFLVTGVLTLAGAVGLRRSLRDVPGGRWAPRLLVVYGLGFIAAGFLDADPALGFPPGTPDAVTAPTGEGLAHMAAGSVAFGSLIALCFVLARACGKFAMVSRTFGVLFAAGLVWSFSGAPGGPITLFAGDVLAWCWTAAVLVSLARTPRAVR